MNSTFYKFAVLVGVSGCAVRTTPDPTRDLCQECPGDVRLRPREATTTCEWGFSIAKHPCPLRSDSGQCPDGEFCLDFRKCSTVGCSDADDCAQPPQPYNLYRPPTANPDIPRDSMVTVTSISDRYIYLSTGAKTIVLGAQLPPDLRLPISIGQSLQLHLCSTAPLDTDFVVVRDQSGRLLFAGGNGGDISKSTCTGAAGFSAERVELGCIPKKFAPSWEAGPVTVFALKFASENTAVVSQGRRGTITIAGRQHTVAVFGSHHLVEWQATDVVGPIESFAVIANQ